MSGEDDDQDPKSDPDEESPDSSDDPETPDQAEPTAKAAPPTNGVHKNGAANNVAKIYATEVARQANDVLLATAPQAIVDLAQACVGFVERALGVRLDYTPETLPLLDHYLDTTRKAARDKPEAVEVVVQASAAYLGEVVRRRYACWWRVEADARSTRIEFRDLFLSFSPADMVRDAISATEDPNAPIVSLDIASFELDDEDRDAVMARLAELPEVSFEEFYAPSTRIEVLDIVVDAVRSRRLTAGDPELTLEPEDYR